MKCLNCGKENDHYLCASCVKPDILDKIFNEIRYYHPDTCENIFLSEYVDGLTEKYEERAIIPNILALFDPEVTEYYYCLYYRMRRDDRFEESAMAYLAKHELENKHSQHVLIELLRSYIPDDFIKPQKWCHTIAGTDKMCCELYVEAAKYYGMIGEYDLSDAMVSKAQTRMMEQRNESLLFSSEQNMQITLNKQKECTNRYRAGKPYWPMTEERRRAVAKFYDKKGIKYPRIEKMPPKTPENAFAPLKECLTRELGDYCAFWCSEVFSLVPARSIYQIGAVKVRNHQVTETFESFIRPWDASKTNRKKAAEEVGEALETIESADDVDLVMPRFFSFVGNDVLVSTEAFGKQAKLISRAARYAGMKEIKNEFMDILDLAADISSEFDFENNTRKCLLTAFTVTEGRSASEKAAVNQKLYEALLHYGK